MPCHVVMLLYAESVGRIGFQSDNIPYSITKFRFIFIFVTEFKARYFFNQYAQNKTMPTYVTCFVYIISW